MANLIVCCDGTWNTPDQKQGDLPSATNVVKLHNSLAEVDGSGAEQKRYYHPGVGTEGGLLAKIAGGGTGEGLDRNIQSAYRWLATTYQPGDRIFLFGFSRGAYTVRSLAGMIARCGLLSLRGADLPVAAVWRMVGDVFACYRKPAAYQPEAGVALCDGAHGTRGPEIHFLGVWDTVGALGIPDDLAILNLFDRTKHQFHDTELGQAVVNARHAVALDEKRQSFTPTLWTKVDGRPGVRQVWFPGVHADVGGGYARTGLSDGALLWMKEEAEACGLVFRPNIADQIRPDFHAALHDSDTGVFALLRSLPRCTPNLDAAGVALLHASAVERHRDPPLFEAAYWPTKVPNAGAPVTVDVFARERWNATGIYLAAGVQYAFTADGEWVDGSVSCGPDGADHDGKFQMGEIIQMAGTALGHVEGLVRGLSGNRQGDFLLTKREERFGWFALIGVIANGVGTDTDGNPVPHETFLIGKGTVITPSAGGYLYAFANDAWAAYDNNRGSVSLTVAR